MANEERVREIARRTIRKHAGSPLTSTPEFWENIVRTILAEAETIAALPVQVPDGWKMMPAEPTEEILSAGINELNRSNRSSMGDLYRAMLAASPTAPASQVLTEEDQLIVQTAKRNICGISTAPLDTRHLLVETVAIIDRLTNKDAEHG